MCIRDSLYPLSSYRPEIPERRDGRRSSRSSCPCPYSPAGVYSSHSFQGRGGRRGLRSQDRASRWWISISEASPKKPSAESVKGAVTSSMQGMVLSLKVKVEDIVSEGDTVAVIEAMKMENSVHAPHSGTVKEIFVSEGATVSPGVN